MSNNNYTRVLVTEGELPTETENNGWAGARGNKWGETYSVPAGDWRKVAAREGRYFVAHNATNDAATTIAGHAAPVLADADATMTKPLIHIIHNGSVSDGILAELDYIQIDVVTAGANGTQACYATQLDRSTRGITTAGTALTVEQPNMQSSNTSAVLAPTAGAIVVPVETSSVRRLSHGTHRPSIEIAGDKYIHVFGGSPEMGQPAAAAAAVRTFYEIQAPVILGPGDVFLFALHGQASQDAAGVYKIKVAWTQR